MVVVAWLSVSRSMTNAGDPVQILASASTCLWPTACLATKLLVSRSEGTEIASSTRSLTTGRPTPPVPVSSSLPLSMSSLLTSMASDSPSYCPRPVARSASGGCCRSPAAGSASRSTPQTHRTATRGNSSQSLECRQTGQHTAHTFESSENAFSLCCCSPTVSTPSRRQMETGVLGLDCRRATISGVRRMVRQCAERPVRRGTSAKQAPSASAIATVAIHGHAVSRAVRTRYCCAGRCPTCTSYA